jgi:hypothetical protein
MKKDFEKADNMFKKLDILLADNNINSIKEYINEIK